MRLIARYGRDLGDSFEVITVFDSKTDRVKIAKSSPKIDTITDIYPAAIWFERKIRDDFGIEFINSFDERPLVQQERFPKNIHPMQKEFTATKINEAEYQPYKYEVIDGDSVFEVSVGPIHAGIIEPGHFHFSQAGEEMLHQEVRHFYTHRGVEKQFEGESLFDIKPIIERVSGNESIAYQIAWRDLVAQSLGIEVEIKLQKRGYFLLELERIIHHLTDLGYIPNDAGFGAALAFCSKLTEDAKRFMNTITGHRFGFGAINFSNSSVDVDFVTNFLNKLEKDIVWFKDWIYDISSLWDRFDTTGILTIQKAKKYSTVGVVARASGVNIDVRRDNSLYKQADFAVSVERDGDVGSRFKVRVNEILESIKCMRNFIEGDLFSQKQDNLKVKDGEYSSFVESSIGELFMVVNIQDSLVDRLFIRDASFINWQAMHLMMPNNIIPDFPLINKSCDLSYAGSDL